MIQDVLNRLKTIRLKFGQFIPVIIPITVQELDAYTTDVLTLAGLEDKPEFRRVVATSMMHLGPITHRKAKRFFAKTIIRALSNQAAFDKIQEIVRDEKLKQENQQAKDCLNDVQTEQVS